MSPPRRCKRPAEKSYFQKQKLFVLAVKNINRNRGIKKPSSFSLLQKVVQKFILRAMKFKRSNMVDFMYISMDLEKFLKENYNLTKR